MTLALAGRPACSGRMGGDNAHSGARVIAGMELISCFAYLGLRVSHSVWAMVLFVTVMEVQA